MVLVSEVLVVLLTRLNFAPPVFESEWRDQLATAPHAMSSHPSPLIPPSTVLDHHVALPASKPINLQTGRISIFY